MHIYVKIRIQIFRIIQTQKFLNENQQVIKFDEWFLNPLVQMVVDYFFYFV